jgi:hypothetical protein
MAGEYPETTDVSFLGIDIPAIKLTANAKLLDTRVEPMVRNSVNTHKKATK